MKDLGVYIHIPFCISKCKYCDFVSSNEINDMTDQYIEAVKAEIEMYSSRFSDHRIQTIFIGGGTPSIIDALKLESVIDKLYESFNISENVEFTMESNPGTLTESKLRKYIDIGINRLSIGLQSFNNEILKTIGRIHTAEDFIQSYNMARRAGFENINIDLIYSLPGQSVQDWENTLREVIKLKPDHISAYALKVEEGTPFEKLLDENKLDLPSDDEDREMYDIAIRLLGEHGIEQYEISNFAKIGYECRHNLIYWNNEEYLGLGVSAHSYICSNRYATTMDVHEYIELISGGKSPVKSEEPKEKKDEMIETIFLSLRLNRGLNLKKFKERFNTNIFDIYGEKIDNLVDQGLLRVDKESIKLTRYGMDVSNQVFVEFL